MSIVGTKGADKLAKTTKLEKFSGAATKKLNEGAAAINVRTQSALQNLGLNGLDNRLAYPGVGSVKGNGGYQFIECVDGGHGVGTKVRDEKVAEGTKGTVKKIEDINDPIRTYRGVDLQNIDPIYIADQRTVVEMPFGGKGEKYTNAEGWRRDLKYFWSELLDRHPEAFSPNNRGKESVYR